MMVFILLKAALNSVRMMDINTLAYKMDSNVGVEINMGNMESGQIMNAIFPVFYKLYLFVTLLNYYNNSLSKYNVLINIY